MSEGSHFFAKPLKALSSGFWPQKHLHEGVMLTADEIWDTQCLPSANKVSMADLRPRSVNKIVRMGLSPGGSPNQRPQGAPT